MTGIIPENTTTITIAADLIRLAHRTVVLTGAGVSTPSGIPDFRSADTGLWNRFEPMEVASLTSFRHDPEKFYEWLHPLAVQVRSAQPNAAHVGLARLQNSGYIAAIITQNIDGLHTRAGSKDVLQVHGSMDTLTCTSCYRHFPASQYLEEYLDHCAIPHCANCGSILKPDVILYDEQLPVQTWLKAEAAARQCDLMLVLGTSLEVMPSARLPMTALENMAHLVIVNQEKTYLDERADVLIHADVAEIIPSIVDEVLNA